MNNTIGWLDSALKVSSANVLEGWGNIMLGDTNYAGTKLRLKSPDSSGMFDLNSKGTKRKWDDINDLEDKNYAFLGLDLGRPSSSTDSSKKSSAIACTMSSSKETDDESSMELDLNFYLNLGSENSHSPKKPATTTSEALKPQPKFDLQLSLSVRPSESVITSASPVPTHYQDLMDKNSMAAEGLTFDEGSTSSRWKHGNKLFPYLATETAITFKQMIDGKSHPIQLISSTVEQHLKSPVLSISGISQPQQRNISTRNCQFSGCLKGARGASGLCIAHGGGWRCQKPGCDKGSEGRTIFCKAHGGGRRCQFLGCTKSAEGRTDYCIAHGGGRRCSHKGCVRASRGKSGLCIRHGGGKRCQRVNCTKSAEGHSGLCITHGGGRRCQYSECTKGAQGSTNFCKAHGGGKRCTYVGCNKGAEGSTPFCKGHGGGKRCAFQGGCSKSVHGGTQFCVAHGGGKRCAFPECTKSARGRTDYCVRHGGGKRCKSEGCGKSAQGSTDFCKAHGGGKHCSWGQPGTNLGAGGHPCDRFVRGKIGLCAAHAALVEDHRVHGGPLEAVVDHNQKPSNLSVMKEAVNEHKCFKKDNHTGSVWGRVDEQNFIEHMNPIDPVVSVPEGRVHGGSLLALIASNAILASHSGSQYDGGMHQQNMGHSAPNNCS